jgi:hypothetical protein
MRERERDTHEVKDTIRLNLVLLCLYNCITILPSFSILTSHLTPARVISLLAVNTRIKPISRLYDNPFNDRSRNFSFELICNFKLARLSYTHTFESCQT